MNKGKWIESYKSLSSDDKIEVAEAIKKNYSDTLSKYAHNDSRGISSVTMKLPDHKVIDEYRNTLRAGQKYTPLRGIAHLTVQHTK